MTEPFRHLVTLRESLRRKLGWMSLDHPQYARTVALITKCTDELIARHLRVLPVRKVAKLGTIAHNRQFTPLDFREYAGGTAAELRVLVQRGLVERVSRGLYFPTPEGWEVVKAACEAA
jgi:hypothetical protein